MGAKDNVIRGYFRDRNRFADLFNGVCFEGEQVIHASELEETTRRYVQTGTVASGKNAGIQRDRDIKMRLKSGETLKLLAMENQNAVDYTMPVRHMQYDVMEYEQQIRELKKQNKQQRKLKAGAEFLCGLKKEDRLAPIYTLCLYHGEERWDGPRSLKDMMDFGEDQDGMSRLFADYPMHLLCVNEETDFDMFRTEVRQLFRALQHRGDKKGLLKLLEQDEEYSHLDMETLEAVSVLMDIPQIWENRDKYINNDEKETGNMCQAIRELMEDARNEGIERGIERGIEQGIERGITKGRSEGVCILISTCKDFKLDYADTAAKLKEKYGLSDAEAEENMKLYWKQ